VGDDHIGAVVEAMAARLEQSHQVVIDTVVVGDCAVDDQIRALVDACREAITNAAKHSGLDALSLYVEVEADAINAYVRDHGRGFVLDQVPSHRRGIASSIQGRMQRHRGSATITSAPEKGTEVHLYMPRRAQ
jgi:signal transduction histidine kinase